MSNKFLDTGATSNLTNGTAKINVKSLIINDLESNKALKTTSGKELISKNLEISDINNLQNSLNGFISNPLNGTLTVNDLISNNTITATNNIKSNNGNIEGVNLTATNNISSVSLTSNSIISTNTITASGVIQGLGVKGLNSLSTNGTIDAIGKITGQNDIEGVNLIATNSMTSPNLIISTEAKTAALKCDNMINKINKNVIVENNDGKIKADDDGLFTKNKINTFQTGINNILLTSDILTGAQLTSGTKNLLIGDSVGKNLNTGINNLLLGYNSAPLLQNGNDNICLGVDSLGQTTNANENICIGKEAGYNLNLGSGNVIIGHRTNAGITSTKNVVIGYGSGGALTSGASNVLIGDVAGGNNLNTGYNNICLGTLSGGGLTTGYNNKILGVSYTSVGTNKNNIVIGDNNNFTTDNNIILGNNITSNNNNEIILGDTSHTVIRHNANGFCNLGSSVFQYKDAYLKGLNINNITKFISDISQLPTAIGDDITLTANTDYVINGSITLNKNIVFNSNNVITGIGNDSSINFGSGSNYGFKSVNNNVYISNLTITGGGNPTTGTTYLNQYSANGQEKLVCGLRKIIPSYNFNCLRVRRASDNTQQDIGFNGNLLDISTLETFINGTSGFIVNLYNQGNITSQTIGFYDLGDPNNQPQILIKSINSVKVPYIQFINSLSQPCCMTSFTTTFNYGINSLSNTEPAQINVGFSGNSYNGTIEFFTSSTPTEGHFEIHTISNNQMRLVCGGGATNIGTFNIAPNFDDDLYHYMACKYPNGTTQNNFNITFDNNILTSQPTNLGQGFDLNVDTVLRLGCRGNAGTFQYDDEFYEIIYFDREQPSNNDFLLYTDTINYYKNPAPSQTIGGLFDCSSIDYNGTAPFYGRTNRFKLNDCNILGTVDLGRIDGFGTINITDNFINGLQTITQDGFKCSNGLSLQYSNNKSVLFKGTTASNSGTHIKVVNNKVNNQLLNLGFNAMLINNNIIHPRSTEIAIEIEAGSTTKLGSIVGNTLINEATNILIKYEDSTTFFNYNSKGIRNYIIESNSGIENSKVGGTAYFSGNTVATNTTNINTFVLISPPDTTVQPIKNNNKIGCFILLGGTVNIGNLELGDKIRGTTSNFEAVVSNIYTGFTYFGAIDFTLSPTAGENIIRISDNQALGTFTNRQFYIIYSEKDPRKVYINAVLQIIGDNNIIYEIALFKNEVLINESISGINATGPGRPVSISTSAYISLKTNDYIDIRIRNTETTATVIVSSGLITVN